MCVLKQELLVVLKLLPADVVGMIVAQQDVPFLPGLREAADLASAAFDKVCSLRSPAKCAGAGVQRVVKDLHDVVIGGRLPDDFADINVAQDNRHLDVTIATFRRRFFDDIAALFVRVLELAREMGLLKLGTVALDGTKIHANASRHIGLVSGNLPPAAIRYRSYDFQQT
jgi:hypothetical protein